MHDTDRTQLEIGYEGPFEYGELPAETYEGGGAELGSILGSIFGEMPGETWGEIPGMQETLEAPLPETYETQLASELLEIGSEDELDHFLGNLISKAAGAIGKVVKSPVGQALGGILKQVAKKALPIAGTALGSFVGGPVGGMIGGKLASAAGNMFGLEIAGLSPEDRDFELARRFVRFAHHAARRAAVAPPRVNPVSVAKAAVVEAAKRFAPGLLSAASAVQQAAAGAAAPTFPGFPAPTPTPTYPGYTPPTPTYTAPIPFPPVPAGPSYGAPAYRRAKGIWYRRGRHIVLVGA